MFFDGLEGVLTTLLRTLREERGMTQTELALYVPLYNGGGFVSCIERLKHKENPMYPGIDEKRALKQFAFALRYEGDPMDLLKEVD